ncbi:MAG: hypothetical protein EPO20_17265 [Betaproteobacteria bacterium]|nr:MAG: hypothetical protein EPO20_17265 [Betaproteobacteria bacterium]
MSAAATAAGYLYASGRLRGRNGRVGEEAAREEKPRDEKPRFKRREPLKVAVIPEREVAAPPPRDKPGPKIQYRTRRWKPE